MVAYTTLVAEWKLVNWTRTSYRNFAETTNCVS